MGEQTPEGCPLTSAQCIDTGQCELTVTNPLRLSDGQGGVRVVCRSALYLPIPPFQCHRAS